MTGPPYRMASSIGRKATPQAIIAPSRTGISMTIPRSRSGRQRGGLQRDVRAERRPGHDGLVELEVVEQRDDLLAEHRHGVVPHVLRPVGAAVAEQIERDDAVAALGEGARQGLVHPLREEQAVE